MDNLCERNITNNNLISFEKEYCHCEADDEEMCAISLPLEETYFDKIVGHLEDILIDSNFQKIQKEFLDKHWTEFDEGEENKLMYTEIFDNYVATIEQCIEDRLKQEIPNFNMEFFQNELRKNKGILEGEVFDMLYTLSDFSAFKELMLDYRAEKEGRIIDLSQDIKVVPFKMPV
ncbi:ADP-ribosylation factor-like protein 2-binding protein isoform X1 [Cimex lectularius]|uniref:ADP-ribosylation factor-like protein 2-binding protein n=2 Tax=Cimex lectularius TaxID=79782 RepID=A0A8I6S7U7_CIMLE|nr:ADP-ribosylation factor-like protein 2-binding protein isoform X1 [Cimex lectularius]